MYLSLKLLGAIHSRVSSTMWLSCRSRVHSLNVHIAGGLKAHWKRGLENDPDSLGGMLLKTGMQLHEVISIEWQVTSQNQFCRKKSAKNSGWKKRVSNILLFGSRGKADIIVAVETGMQLARQKVTLHGGKCKGYKVLSSVKGHEK